MHNFITLNDNLIIGWKGLFAVKLRLHLVCLSIERISAEAPAIGSINGSSSRWWVYESSELMFC